MATAAPQPLRGPADPLPYAARAGDPKNPDSTPVTAPPEPVHSYSAETAPRGFFAHAWPFGYPRRAWEGRILLWNFLRRDLLGRFKNSLGGVFWVMVHPIFQFLVYYVIFGLLFDRGNVPGQPDGFFAVYLFSAIVAFSWITENASRGMNAITSNANLVRKVVFPCELLPLTPVLVAGVVYLVSCLVLLVVGLITGNVVIGLHFLAWPVLVALLLVFGAGLAMLLATANLLFRDVQHLWGIFQMAWFFLTPNVWDVPMIRDKLAKVGYEGAVDLMVLNPAYCFVMAQRQIFGVGDRLVEGGLVYSDYFPLSLGQNLLGCTVWALLMLFLGYGFFMSRKRKFADLV